MKLSPKNKEIIVNILLLFVLPLIVYWIVLWNNAITREYFKSLDLKLTEEWKKEIEKFEAESEKNIELNILEELGCLHKNNIKDKVIMKFYF